MKNLSLCVSRLTFNHTSQDGEYFASGIITATGTLVLMTEWVLLRDDGN